MALPMTMALLLECNCKKVLISLYYVHDEEKGKIKCLSKTDFTVQTMSLNCSNCFIHFRCGLSSFI